MKYSIDSCRFYVPLQKLQENSNIEISVPDKNGVTPQAFIVAAPNWEWPKERQNITERYPKLTEWGSNQSKDDWHNAL